LAGHPTLEEVKAVSINLTHYTAIALSKTILENINITRLTLRDADLTSEKVVDLCEGLRQNVTIEYLDLRHNNFGKNGLAVLIDTFQKTQSLKTLLLEDMTIHHDEAE
jgi:Ran GTPase-activating protein (RanGAP) involved in mRNA processing and transport